MNHEPTCDLTVYGPEAKGVFCTCEAPDDEEALAVALRPPPGMPIIEGPLETLQGDAALALRRFRKASGDLKRAQAAHAKAIEDFTAAVAK